MSTPPPPAVSSKHKSMLLVKPKGELKRSARHGQLKTEIIQLLYSKFSDISRRLRDPQLYVYLLELLQEADKPDPLLTPEQNRANRQALIRQIVTTIFPEADGCWEEVRALIEFAESNHLVEPVGCLRRTSKALGNCFGLGHSS